MKGIICMQPLPMPHRGNIGGWKLIEDFNAVHCDSVSIIKSIS